MRARLFSCLFLAAWCGAVWLFLDWAAQPSQAPVDDWGRRLDWNVFFTRYLLPEMPVAERFDFPLRPPDGEGAFVAKPFAFHGHAGEDWNTAPGNGDLGEPVRSPLTAASSWPSTSRGDGERSCWSITGCRTGPIRRRWK